MTKRTRKKRWSYTTGEKGRNRVRVFQHESGLLMLEYRPGGKRKRFPGHRDRDRAKQRADEGAQLANPRQSDTGDGEEPRSASCLRCTGSG